MCVFVCFCAAANEGGGREQNRHQPAGGAGAGGAVPQSAVLQRRSILQQSEFNAGRILDLRFAPNFPAGRDQG